MGHHDPGAQQMAGRLSSRDTILIFSRMSLHLVPVTHELIELPARSLVLLDTASPEHHTTQRARSRDLLI